MENRPMFHDLYAVMYEYPDWFSLSDEKKNAVEKLSERYLISCEEVASVFIRCRRNVQDTEIELSKMMTDIYLKGGTIIG